MICRTRQLLAEVVDLSSNPEHVHKKGSMFCEMLVLSSELMPQLFFKQAVLETDRDSEADVISTKGVHPGGRGFSECTLSASASSSMCSLCSKIGQALQRFPVVRTRFSAHWSQADGVQKVMHCLA
jgi:hypothetical protein